MSPAECYEGTIFKKHKAKQQWHIWWVFSGEQLPPGERVKREENYKSRKVNPFMACTDFLKFYCELFLLAWSYCDKILFRHRCHTYFKLTDTKHTYFSDLADTHFTMTDRHKAFVFVLMEMILYVASHALMLYWWWVCVFAVCWFYCFDGVYWCLDGMLLSRCCVLMSWCCVLMFWCCVLMFWWYFVLMVCCFNGVCWYLDGICWYLGGVCWYLDIVF